MERKIKMCRGLKKCQNCELYKNQPPLLDELTEKDVMWVGLSAKMVVNGEESLPLARNTNTGKILETIELELKEYSFYKTNLVKCLLLDNNKKIRYPTKMEITKCLDNLSYEIEIVKPKTVFLLGKIVYDNVYKYYKDNKLDVSKLFYIEHTSYIYIYKRKYLKEYIEKVKKLIITKGE